jgi:predicted nuclease of predicted toxin-antitoxin system
MREELIIISKDQDFFHLANQPDTEVKLIWVRLGNCRMQALLQAFQRFWPEIEACLAGGDKVIEIR